MLPIRRFCLLVTAVGLLSCVLFPVLAQEEEPVLPEDRVAIFDYDAEADLQVEVVGTEERDGATVQDITFVPIADEDPVKGYIVTPTTEAESYAGILWGHWLGEENANRDQFLEEAVGLAKEGIVSVMVDAMWSEEGWYRSRSENLDNDYEIGVNQAIRFRRAMDLLLAQPNVDPERIAFVGHDYSGMYGILASAVDNRASAYVFIAIAPSFYDWAFYAAEPEDKDAYFAENDVIEPMAYLPFIKGKMLFQYAKEDFFVPPDRRDLALDTAIETREVKIYETAEHNMIDPEIAADRDAWLLEALGITESE